MSNPPPNPPRIFGEVFEDGQFRGSHKIEDIPNHAVVVGDYMLWEMGDGDIGIGYRVTGEMGVFKVADFEPYIKAFFGLNF